MLTYFESPEKGHLASTLRSCSGFSAFRAEFRGEITLENVVMFLLFSQSFPRSVRYCIRELDQALHSLSGMPIGSYSNEAERLTGSMLAQMNFSSMENVWSSGLHQYVDSLQKQFNGIGQEVFETYVLLPAEILNLAPPNSSASQLQWQQQQQ